MSKYEMLVSKWQRLLKLQDYDIQVKVRTTNAMTTEDNVFLGRIEHNLEERCAIIELLDEEGMEEATSKNSFGHLFNLEHTIVHELLHLSFIGMNDYNELHIEQQINHIARLLINAYSEE